MLLFAGVGYVRTTIRVRFVSTTPRGTLKVETSQSHIFKCQKQAMPVTFRWVRLNAH